MTRKFSASISFMFREVPLIERFAAAKAAGFDGVEIQVLAEGDMTEMAAAARAADVQVILINVDLGDYLQGGLGLSGVPGREATFREAAERACDAARLLGASFVHLGPSRIPQGVTRELCVETYLANAEAALTMADGAPFTLLLETMNPVDAPTGLFTDADAAANLLRETLGETNVFAVFPHSPVMANMGGVNGRASSFSTTSFIRNSMDTLWQPAL